MHKALSVLSVSLLAGSALAAVAAAPVAAQSMQGQQQMQNRAPAAQPGAPAGQSQLPDGKLESFAAAAVEIQTINEEARKRLSSPDTSETPEELKRRANEDIVEAVRDEGLTVEEFNEIAQQVQNNPELRSRVVAMIQQKNM